MKSNTARAHSSPAFDWTMALLTALMVCGPLIDGWAHAHGEVDQSFLTPWHAMLYGATALNGLVLLAAGLAGLRRGYTFRNALPPGYWVAACGVLLFLVGGGFDAWWHTAFGIETGIALLISPSHLVLALSAGMIATGPLQSIAAQYGRAASGWKIVGPAVISVTGVAIILGFFLAYAQPIEDGFTPLTMRPATSDAVYPMLYAVDPRGALTRVALPPKVDLETIAISPDGKHIVYRVNRYQNPDALPPSDLYVAGIDGSHPVQVSSSGRHDTQPAWSPDGRSIAYVSMPAQSSGNFEIRLMPAAGGAPRTLLAQTTTISQLSWSPDGTSLAYGSRNGTTAMIGVLDVATGKTHWLAFTANAGTPVWTARGVVYASNDGSVREAALDGSDAHTLIAKSDGSPAASPAGRHLAYVANDLGGDQLFVADADGSHARDVSQLSGLDVQDAAWAPDGRVLFVALGRRDPTHTGIGKSLAMAALILQGIVIAGAALLVVRRFAVPFGSLTFMLTAFALAMALQSDFYVYAIGAAVTGVLADAAIAIYKDRLRGGLGFYALGFLLPLVFTALFQIVTVRSGGGKSGWEWNLLLGAPLLAGIAGVMIALCFDSPLERTGDPATPANG